MKSKLPYIALGVCLAWMLLVLLSWILTAVMPDIAMRSMLSAEGIRWLFGRLIFALATPVLVWLAMGISAYGALRRSQLLTIRRPLELRERFALQLIVAELSLIVCVMLLLTLLPQPLLLSATGGLAHSSLVHSLVPVGCISLIIISITYSAATGRIHHLGDIYDMLTEGFTHAGGIFLFYLLIATLYRSAEFIFMF